MHARYYVIYLIKDLLLRARYDVMLRKMKKIGYTVLLTLLYSGTDRIQYKTYTTNKILTINDAAALGNEN